SNATDSDGTISGFRVISVESGTVQIAAENFNIDDNAVVDSDHSLAWLSDEGQSGEILAFTVIALDNDGLLSDPPVEVMVQVTKKPEPEPQPEPEPEPEPEPQPGNIIGQPENPIHLDNTTLQPGSYLEHVVISGADTVI